MAGTITRRVAVITGACGGMGRALARSFGGEMHLVLTDIDEKRLAAFAQELTDEGCSTDVVAGALGSADLLAALTERQRGAGELGVLVHTAGLSPVMADWRGIMEVNLVATEMLLRAFEPALVSGSVAVLIASMAGHVAPAVAEIDTVLADPLAPDMLDRLGVLLEPIVPADRKGGMENLSYGLSKREVIRICERRAAQWAARGARIVSISPGTMWTPMLRTELASNPGAVAVLDATPLKRWGTPADIAAAARFLASDAAGFVTGSDLRVDGGATPAMNGPVH